MDATLQRWLGAEPRCTARFREHLAEADRLVETEQDLFPLVHCLLRFPEQQLPRDIHTPEEARDWRRRVAQESQERAREYLTEQRLDFDALWLINAVSVRLPWEGLLAHLVNLAVYLPLKKGTSWFDHVPACRPVGIEEVDDAVFQRIEREMSAWKVSGRAMAPAALLPGLPAARLLSGLGGAGVRVAVLDTGIDAGHPDLSGRVEVPEEFAPVNGCRTVLAELRPGERFSQTLDLSDPAIKRIEVHLVCGLRRKGGAFLQRPLKPRIAARIVSPRGTVTALAIDAARSGPVPVGQTQVERSFYDASLNPLNEHGPHRIEVTCAEAEAVFAWKRALVQMEARAFDGQSNAARSWPLSFVGAEDDWGHGTRVAGVIGGSGASGGLYPGLAPEARLLSLKVTVSAYPKSFD